MRILFALNAGEGGATLSARDLMDGLNKRGHTCFAVLPTGATPEGRDGVARVAQDVASVHLSWWNKKFRSKLWKRPLYVARDAMKSGGYAGTIRELAALCKRWDVDVVHTNTSVTIEPALAARLAGRAHVWHIREEIGGDAFRFWLPEPLLARTFESLSSAVIANSRASAALFARTGRMSKVSVVHNGIDVSRFVPGAGARLRALWTKGQADVVLVGMVASMGSALKRHHLFVEAAGIVAAREPSARFVIAGFDPDATGGFSSEVEYARSVKQLAREVGLGEKIVFAGHVDDVPAIMDAIDLLAHPFEGESFGRVAIEAMAASRAVAGANGGGIAEIVEPEVTGLLAQPRDASALAAAILALIRDPARRRQMGERGRARVESKFSIDSTVSAVESVYERVTADQKKVSVAFERSTA